MMFADPNVHSIIWWDMCDTGAFVVDGGLVRADLSEKPSFTRIKGLIQSWTTHSATGTTNASGIAGVQGFGGDYQVTVTSPAGDVKHATAHINERGTTTVYVDGFAPQAPEPEPPQPEPPQPEPPETKASTFYFAEGTTRPGFDPFLCIQNPGTAPADVKVTYMKGDGTTKEQTLTVAASSRSTIVVKDLLGTGNDSAHDFSSKVECTNGQQIIAERPMYFNYKGVWTGGHDVVGYTP